MQSFLAKLYGSTKYGYVGITISMMFGDAIWGKVASNN
jgi:hypothetical protein